MLEWRVIHKEQTESTNSDAANGSHLDVYTADFQTCGRGRLDHKWLSPPKTNLMMSAVLSVEGISPEVVSTFPLVAGLAVLKSLLEILRYECRLSIKWPNDILADAKKIAGILCERKGDNVIVGIGVNVLQKEFAPEIASRATSLVNVQGDLPCALSINKVRDAILDNLSLMYMVWKSEGFTPFHSEIGKFDFLKGRVISVVQTDDDSSPTIGKCTGIASDGSLMVAGEKIYAGEVHIASIFDE